MSVTVYFANIAKKRNSTYQGTFTTSYDCVLKDATSLDRPTFLISAATMDYNAAKWDNRYYFIDDVVSVRQGQWEVTCVLDVLATYKAEILASTQFVCYSSHLTSAWLLDERVPVLNSEDVNTDSTDLSPAFNGGFYVLSVVGPNGNVFAISSKADLDKIVDEISNWKTTSIDSALQGTAGSVTYDWTTTEDCLESLSKMLTQSGILGNAYSNAPQMIRSCKWVPFTMSDFSAGYGQMIYLGEFQTSVTAPYCRIDPVWRRFDVSIPWHYNDWRRAACESVYLYLPFVGNVNLSADELVGYSSLEVDLTLSAVDGSMQYCVKAGSTVLGLYSATCNADYQIGVNQKASAGEVFQSVLQGADKIASIGVNASIDPVSDLAVMGSMALEGAIAVYNAKSVQKSTHPTVIGSVAGAVNSKSPTSIICTVISHPTAIAPADMAATMGRPTMQPMSLATLTGYCQCANAHVAAAAQARELDAIDTYLNSGFFIE